MNTAHKFHLYSIVPVRSQKIFKGASLAIIGKSAYVNKQPITSFDTFGKHYVKYNDYFVHKIFKIRKYAEKNFAQKNLETIWYAEMPDEISRMMFNPLSAQACTNITVLMGENENKVFLAEAEKKK